MKSPLRILQLEDDPDDAALVREFLTDEGIDCDLVRVETRAEFLAALETDSVDLVLADYSLPSFDGVSALKIAREKLPDTPFIFVSGTMGEELAIQTLKSGATDYVLKHRLSRLAPAVRRALAEGEERAARQEAEKSRSEAESLFRALFDQVTVGVAIADLSGRIIKANPALEAMLGYGAGDLSHTLLVKLTYPEDAAVGAEADEELCAGRRTSYELEKRFVRRDGTVCWTRVVVSLIREKDGAPRFSVNLIEDITERKEMARRFLQAEKMEVVGRLAAGFAHDFNNLLTLINGYSQLLLGRISQQDPARRELQEIRGAGERATTLTQRLLTFSRQQVRQPHILDLSSIVTGLDHMLRRLIGGEIRLTMRLDRESGLIEEDQTQIEQIIMNLAINARDAMPGGGELTIATGNAHLDGMLADSQGVAPGDYVVLTVTDTGHGMDEATKSRIFVPFFTTKEVGKGTGLGLCMAREVIQQSRGAITVDSEPGRGTSFRICLPRVAGEAESALTNLALSIGRASRGGSETILVVEDDDAVRELAREILEPAGYRVLPARDGAEALTTAQGEANEIHLLMTDVAMPNMRGTELAARLAGSRPEMKVLYVSGHSTLAAAGEEPVERGGAYLEKPFTPDTLLQGVREILDAPPEVNILVVDDDPAIRSFLRHVLRPSGHRILEASNGRQAVQHLRQRKVDLLITDLIMPDQEGLETIHAARKEFPDLPVVAMSGGFGEQFLSLAEKLGAREILHKPFGADAVREMVRRLLATRTNKPASVNDVVYAGDPAVASRLPAAADAQSGPEITH